jgi:prepilin-type N-terminal cleavage/methylation domain-containing protein
MKAQKGFSLIEVMIAVAIIATVGVAIFSGLTVSANILIKTDTNDTARSLAISQMEFVKNTYWNDSSYPVANNLIASGYSISTIIDGGVVPDGNMQKITVKINKSLIPTPVFTLEDYKVR